MEILDFCTHENQWKTQTLFLACTLVPLNLVWRILSQVVVFVKKKKKTETETEHPPTQYRNCPKKKIQKNGKPKKIGLTIILFC